MMAVLGVFVGGALGGAIRYGCTRWFGSAPGGLVVNAVEGDRAHGEGPAVAQARVVRGGARGRRPARRDVGAAGGRHAVGHNGGS